MWNSTYLTKHLVTQIVRSILIWLCHKKWNSICNNPFQLRITQCEKVFLIQLLLLLLLVGHYIKDKSVSYYKKYTQPKTISSLLINVLNLIFSIILPTFRLNYRRVLIKITRLWHWIFDNTIRPVALIIILINLPFDSWSPHFFFLFEN